MFYNETKNKLLSFLYLDSQGEQISVFTIFTRGSANIGAFIPIRPLFKKNYMYKTTTKDKEIGPSNRENIFQSEHTHHMYQKLA